MSRAVTHRYHFAEFTVDGDQKVLLRNGAPRPLPPKIFDTLLILVENAGRLVGKDELMNQLWPDTFVEEANLTFNIQQLRKSLGDDARQPRFIETVSRRGYRFIAPVEKLLSEKRITIQHAANTEESVAPPVIAGVESALAAEHEKKGRRGWSGARLHKILVVAAAVTVVFTALGGWLLWSRSKRPQPTANRLMLAVLPFQNLTGDASQEYFSDGLTEEMISQLGNLDPQHLGVIARTSVMHYKNHQAGLEQIGQELGVQYVLEGSVRRESDNVRITAQLIQVKDQTHLWSREYDRELSHLLLLQDEIAQDVAGEIRTTLGETEKKTDTARQTSPSPPVYEAYDLYLKGEYFFNKRTIEGFEQAIDYFQQAAAKDPTYARAYAGIADCYALMGGYSGQPQTEFMLKARAAALHALQIDESLPEAHTALALIVQNYDWDWQTSEREFRRAIELNPNYATAHHWYAEHLTWLGRFDEALRESERARQLDPLSLIIAADNGAILYYSRQYDRSIAQFLAVREMDPNFPRAYMIEAPYEQKGSFADALTNLEKLQTFGDANWTLAELSYCYGRSGQQAQAQRILEKLLQLDRHHQIEPAPILVAYLGLGNKDKALVYLEKAYAQHSNILTTLKVDPRMDALRGDVRFQDLLHRVHLSD
jgi:TolB-like protein/DNA-binding winged helix-turn-helix (wHTH) protein/Tfp pilus assembly protein PilF